LVSLNPESHDDVGARARAKIARTVAVTEAHSAGMCAPAMQADLEMLALGAHGPRCLNMCSWHNKQWRWVPSAEWCERFEGLCSDETHVSCPDNGVDIANSRATERWAEMGCSGNQISAKLLDIGICQLETHRSSMSAPSREMRCC
jgi:hypothetical protein